jgi:mannose-1-phosphate guanylyltransferase
MHAIILAGGVGTRLWPRSRESTPKQFSDITGCGRTMLQSTLDRLQGIASPEEIYVVTGSRYADLAREQAAGVPAENVIGEPLSRNTAPAIGLACFHLRRQGVRGVVAILPADHIIRNVGCFQSAMRQAERAAEKGNLVLLGIEPDMPHTGYGYIKRGDVHAADSADELPVYSVARFH